MRMLCLLLAMFIFSTAAVALDNTHLLWDEKTDHGRGDYARAVAVSGRTAVVAELLGTAGGGSDFVVRAYDSVTGDTRWEDHVPSSPGIVTDVFVAAAGGSAFALGYAPGSGISSTDLFVRAYNINTGGVLWTNYWDAGLDDLPQGIAVTGGRVTIVGYGGNTVTPQHDLDGLIRTLDAATGSVLWEKRIDKTGSLDTIWAVAADGNRVVTAGNTFVGDRRDLVLRCWDAQEGTLLWEVVKPAVSPIAVQINAGKVFVVGIDTASTTKTFLAAFNVARGNLMWRAASLPGYFTDLAVSNTQLVAVGTSTGRGYLIQSLHPNNGNVQWTDVDSVAEGYADIYRHVVMTSRAVYVVGTAGEDFNYSEILVRGYSASGALLFDDRSHRTKSSAGMDLSTAGGVLVVAGSESDVTTDAVIRAYNIAAIERRF